MRRRRHLLQRAVLLASVLLVIGYFWKGDSVLSALGVPLKTGRALFVLGLSAVVYSTLACMNITLPDLGASKKFDPPDASD